MDPSPFDMVQATKGHTPSEQEYSDFMRRARWKTCQSTGYLRQVGKYLEIL